MIVDALAVQQLMAIQKMLELELLVALVANVDAAILLMQMIVQEDSAKGTNSQYKLNQTKLNSSHLLVKTSPHLWQ